MRLATRVGYGAYAGLCGGIAVAALFFVGDVIRLHPFSSSLALAVQFLGPSGTSIDFPLVSQIIDWGGAGLTVIAFTAIHLAVFVALGVGAVLLFHAFGWSLNMGTGAVYGLLACSTVFYAGIALASPGVVSELPNVWAVVGGNLVAGGLMGGQVALLDSSSSTSGT